MSKQLTNQQFINKSKLKHGDRYDYSNVKYIGYLNKVNITCKEHGQFYQIPHKHMSGQGCSVCGRIRSRKKRYTTQMFIVNANKIHDNKFSYDKTQYINNIEPVTISCNQHGDFITSPANHLSKKNGGCRQCFSLFISSNQLDTLQSFLLKLPKKQINKYSYSKSEYINTHTKMLITCPVHGDFRQTPHAHLVGKGCDRCARAQSRQSRRNTKEQVVNRCIQIHGDKYDYSKSQYVTYDSKMNIICKIHGQFWQCPSNHINGKGCPRCRSSHGERLVRSILDQIGIKYNQQFKFQDCINPKSGKKLIFDFYIPSHNVCIQFNGSQHYEPTSFNKRLKQSNEVLTYKLNKQIERDEIKRKYCDDSGIKLIIVKYTYGKEKIKITLLKELTHDTQTAII